MNLFNTVSAPAVLRQMADAGNGSAPAVSGVVPNVAPAAGKSNVAPKAPKAPAKAKAPATGKAPAKGAAKAPAKAVAPSTGRASTIAAYYVPVLDAMRKGAKSVAALAVSGKCTEKQVRQVIDRARGKMGAQAIQRVEKNTFGFRKGFKVPEKFSL